MYSVRRILCGAAVILFIAAFVSARIGGGQGNNEQAAPDGGAQTGTVAQTSSASVFDGADGQEKFVAHRGYSAAAPENTALAFELAGKAAFWGIETDICETYDGEFVCMHDDTVDRTTDGSGTVGEYSYAALRSLTVDSGENIALYSDLKIPSMVEYLNICVTYGCVPIIEIKSVSNYDKFLETIYASNLQNRCVVIGQIDALEQIRARDESITLMVVGYSNIEYQTYIELINTISGTRGILYNAPSVNQDVLNEVHGAGLLCGVWSVDTAEDAQKFVDDGVDFVVTNEIPGGLNRVVNDTE